MNKQEWKAQHAAARLLLDARFSRNDSYSALRPDSKQKDIVWDITYRHIMENMHPSIAKALFTHDRCVVDIKKKEHLHWAMKNNSMAFNRKHCKRRG